MSEKFTTDQYVQAYVSVRERLRQLDEEFAERKAELIKDREYIEGKLSMFMTTHNLDNIKTQHGTVHWNTRHTASLADPEIFMKFVVDNSLFDLLDRKANAAAVREYVEKNNTLPPGCNLNTIQSLGVRRPTGK